MRLITRSDFDGLACAALLEELGLIDEIFYTHPKDIQDGKIDVTRNDILANVPYAKGCGMWFDHHLSEHERQRIDFDFDGASEPKESCARVIFDYFMPKHRDKLERFSEMITAVDKADGGNYTREDILDPKDWMMLAFIADPRTGFGYQRTFRISNFDLMKSLPSRLRHQTIEEIMGSPDFLERIDVYKEQIEEYKTFLRKHARTEGDAIILDFRGMHDLPTGNRFIEYVLFPEQNISVRLIDSRDRQRVMISVGHSTINRSSTINVGSMLLQFGGGGHPRVGTCQVMAGEAGIVLNRILNEING